MSWVAAAFGVVVVGIVVWAVLAQRRRDRAPLRRVRTAGTPARTGAAPRTSPAARSTRTPSDPRPGDAGPPEPADAPEPAGSESGRADSPPATPSPRARRSPTATGSTSRRSPSPTRRAATGLSTPTADHPEETPARRAATSPSTPARPAESEPAPERTRPPAHRRVGTLSLVATPFTPSTPGNLRTSTAYSATRFLGSHYVVAGPRRVKVPFDLQVHEMELEPGELGAVERFVRCRVVVIGNPASGSVHVQEEIPVATVDVSALREVDALADALDGTRGDDDAEGTARAAYDVALTLAARRFAVTELIDLGEAPTARILLPPIPAPREAPGRPDRGTTSA